MNAHPWSDSVSSSQVHVGLGGTTRNACAVLATSTDILGICEQERITRVRAAGVNPTGLPDEAIDELLRRFGRRRGDVRTYVVAGPEPDIHGAPVVQLDHHLTHACSAFLPSPFDHATVVVCDSEPPHVTVWDGNDVALERIDWPWHGLGPAELYSKCARTLGFTTIGGDQRMEALARLVRATEKGVTPRFFRLGADHIQLEGRWHQLAQDLGDLGCNPVEHASLAAGLQQEIGDLIIGFLTRVRRTARAARYLCLGGSLFHNSYFNARVKSSGLFDEVFVPINTGNAGLAVGAALRTSERQRQHVSPFLGPSYDSAEIKAVLDNCKLSYDFVSENSAIAIAVEALKKGQLVGWFEGPMEWGARALGARSILANPFAPFVLENLNRFLKQRDPWRGYALTCLESAVSTHFDGPAASPFMECDYIPREPRRFREILPGSDASIRIQTATSETPPLFRSLLDAWGHACGVPVVVNTSFNGFREPMVCSPRDAVRVFFGTGIDKLVLGRFVLSK